MTSAIYHYKYGAVIVEMNGTLAKE